MDRLIFKSIDFDHKPLTAEQRKASRKAKGFKPPREADSYRGAKRNDRSHVQRCNPSLEGGYRGSINLNRSAKWGFAETYQDARDLSPSNREVV
jgi:hypothetical protein